MSDDKPDDIRVMIADDSAVVRGIVRRMIAAGGGASVVESVANGRLAVRALSQRQDIDVVVLDIEMPEMDGLSALTEILKMRPGLPVIMASTLTQRNAAISLEALEAGAADYIPKPTAGGLVNHESFREELTRKIAALGRAWRQRGSKEIAQPSSGEKRRFQPVIRSSSNGEQHVPPTASTSAFSLRQAGKWVPKVICIGSSTGGPQAILRVLQHLPPSSIGQPVLIVQHMPATFTKILAERISRLSPWQCKEAADGDALSRERALLAPGDYHMIVERNSGEPRIRLTQGPAVNFCRPAVDCTFQSAGDVFGGRVLAIVLTGMGSDGCQGSQKIVDAGGTVIAQDSETSVVWGMPGAVATAGLCSAVLPIEEIPRSIAYHANGGHS